MASETQLDHMAALREAVLRKVVPARDDVVEWRGVRYVVLSPMRGSRLPDPLPYGVHVPAASKGLGASLLCVSPLKTQILLPAAECVPVSVDPGHVVDVVLAELIRVGVI